MDKGI